ncbi:DUF4214 domain-containing protein [Halomonas sp. Bachu 37]|uniref:DUF4214 domain-containing protein n=1 Tax=Halomonas kashgarensis TaxID=3084920 RepID=UPI003216E599
MQKVIFGTNGDNHLSANDNVNMFGFDGNDTLVADWNDHYYYAAFMMGGNGNDSYHFDGDYGVIVDTGGSDTLSLPGYSADYLGAFVNGQDLVLVNEWTGQGVFILDAKGRGLVETITSQGGESFNASQIESMVYNQGLGDISYSELETLTGGMFAADQFIHTKEINKAWADLDWGTVWQQIADRGDLSAEAIADTLNANITARLSPEALQLWNAQGGQQALVSSTYEGVEQNLPGATAPPAPSPFVPQEAAENIALLYEAALNRLPDIEGLNFWIDEFAGGMSFEGIAHSFIQSEEFISRFNINSDEAFIDQLYLNVLGRTADEGGRDYWLGEIDKGLPQAEVLNYFAVSEENVANANWLAGLNDDSGNWTF